MTAACTMKIDEFGELPPCAGAASARVEIDDGTLVGVIERQLEAVRARELLGDPHGLDAAHQRRHPFHHVHLDVAVDKEVAAKAHLLPGLEIGSVIMTVRIGSMIMRGIVRMGIGSVTV